MDKSSRLEKVQIYFDKNEISTADADEAFWHLLRHWSGLEAIALVTKDDGSREVWELK